jgi:hypothetical protein
MSTKALWFNWYCAAPKCYWKPCDSDRAALLNNYICRVFTVDDGINNTSSLSGSAVSSATLPFFTTSQVKKLIKELKTGSANGPEGFPAIFYKNTASIISYPFSVCLTRRFKRRIFSQFGSSLL